MHHFFNFIILHKYMTDKTDFYYIASKETGYKIEKRTDPIIKSELNINMTQETFVKENGQDFYGQSDKIFYASKETGYKVITINK